jgi:hypothetical protein
LLSLLLPDERLAPPDERDDEAAFLEPPPDLPPDFPPLDFAFAILGLLALYN